MTPGTDTYPYKAYFEKLLSYEPRTLRTQMKACSLWVKDTAGHMNDLKYAAATQAKTAFAVADDNVNIDATQLALTYPNESQNDGLRERHKAIDTSKKLVLMDRLHIDLFQREKFLPNGVDVRLRFNRVKPQFYMMTVALSSGKVPIQSIVMWVRKIKPTPAILNAINQRLNSKTVKYPLRRVEVKTFTNATGSQSKITDHLFQGQMPKRVLIGFVENAAFNEDATKNPFDFKHENIKKLEISINGETMTTRPFEPDFANDEYLRSYLILYQGLGKLGGDWAPDITLEEYKNRYTLWCVDFTKDQEAQLGKFHLIKGET